MNIRPDDHRANEEHGGNGPGDRDLLFGYVTWKASWGRPPLIILIGTWIVGLPILVTPILGLGLFGYVALTGQLDRFLVVFAVVLLIVGATIVISSWWLSHTTKTFCLLRNRGHADAPEESEFAGEAEPPIESDDGGAVSRAMENDSVINSVILGGDLPGAELPPAPAAIAKGSRMFLLITALFVGTEIPLLTSANEFTQWDYIRAIIKLGALSAVWQGYEWVIALVAITFPVAAIFQICFSLVPPTALSVPLGIIAAAAYVGIATILIRSRSLNAFFRAQRSIDTPVPADEGTSSIIE